MEACDLPPVTNATFSSSLNIFSKPCSSDILLTRSTLILWRNVQNHSNLVDFLEQSGRYHEEEGVLLHGGYSALRPDVQLLAKADTMRPFFD